MPWEGLPTAAAGAVLAIVLLQRALPVADHAEGMRAALRRLAVGGGARPRDPAMAWLPPAGDDAGLARQARTWLRRTGRRVRLAGERALTLRQLVRRPGRLRLTATHLDATFDLDAGDVRVRRLGLDLDPGWVPWLGLVVAIHYVVRQAGDDA